jgi:hypothetical protein
MGGWLAELQDGQEVHRFQPVEIEHVDQEHLLIRALERGADVADGGYLSEGELRMGWYAAAESSIRSKGTLYFALHPHGQSATGRWVGISHDGVVGVAVMLAGRRGSCCAPVRWRRCGGW